MGGRPLEKVRAGRSTEMGSTWMLRSTSNGSTFNSKASRMGARLVTSSQKGSNPILNGSGSRWIVKSSVSMTSTKPIVPSSISSRIFNSAAGSGTVRLINWSRPSANRSRASSGLVGTSHAPVANSSSAVSRMYLMLPRCASCLETRQKTATSP